MKILVYANNCAPYDASPATHVLESGQKVHGYAFTDPATGAQIFATSCVRLEKKLLGNIWTDAMVKQVFLKVEHVGMDFNLTYHKTWVVPLGFTFQFFISEEMGEEGLNNWRKGI